MLFRHMIGSTTRETSLFYVAFGQQASLIKDDLLEEIDRQLDDDELVEIVRDRLSARSTGSASTGRKTIAPDQLLRCVALKHIKGFLPERPLAAESPATERPRTCPTSGQPPQ